MNTTQQVNPQSQPQSQPVKPVNGAETIEQKVARLEAELAASKLAAVKGGNCLMRREGNMLHIVVDLSQQVGASKSGKSTVIATTAGNKEIGDGIKVGLNIYR
jgi:hypothetical protein